MLRSYLDPLTAAVLVTALALATAAPVTAEAGRGRFSCPCWTRGEARRAVTAVLAINDDYVCTSGNSTQPIGIEEQTSALFTTPLLSEGDGLFLSARLAIEDEVLVKGSCRVDVDDVPVLVFPDLTETEAVACVQILGRICLDTLRYAPEHTDDD